MISREITHRIKQNQQRSQKDRLCLQSLFTPIVHGKRKEKKKKGYKNLLMRTTQDTEIFHSLVTLSLATMRPTNRDLSGNDTSSADSKNRAWTDSFRQKTMAVNHYLLCSKMITSGHSYRVGEKLFAIYCRDLFGCEHEICPNGLLKDNRHI
ncbi:hypothetical protein CDAR_607991 [Caerostris darwini]|uniref:Uncharacterized protein n=1 Tax=Caerostris darwini TaxID=1538125 RepID=A0AAV4ULD8_9ARAC|nr:hypothetical protein CDAR_607991 [Caerostris darwini]